MIKLKIITLGKLKEKYLKDAEAEYLKRLSAYTRCELIELEPVRIGDNPSPAEIEKALKTEAELIKKKIPENGFVTAMCIEGKQYSSEELSSLIFKGAESGGTLVYIIGSSFGLHDSIKSLADIKLSFSKMTFPHQLFRIMLLEQIYRGFKIEEGSKYHK